MKTIIFNNVKYNINRLLELTKQPDLRPFFNSGECIDENTGEVFDISDIETVFKEKYEAIQNLVNESMKPYQALQINKTISKNMMLCDIYNIKKCSHFCKI